MSENRSEAAKEARRVRNRIASKRRKAERAIAEGRTPGVVGGPVKHKTDLERSEASRRAAAKWRAENIEAVRIRDAEIQRRKRRERAATEGRKLQKVGGDSKFTDDEKRENARRNSSRYAAEHPEKLKELRDKNYREKKDEYLERCRNRRALKLAGGTHTQSDIDAILVLQKGCCVFCLKPFRGGKFEIDHHMPLALGGTNDRSNLKLLHQKCNRSKGARDPVDHAQRNGMLCW